MILPRSQEIRRIRRSRAFVRAASPVEDNVDPCSTVRTPAMASSSAPAPDALLSMRGRSTLPSRAKSPSTSRPNTAWRRHRSPRLRHSPSRIRYAFKKRAAKSSDTLPQLRGDKTPQGPPNCAVAPQRSSAIASFSSWFDARATSRSSRSFETSWLHWSMIQLPAKGARDGRREADHESFMGSNPKLTPCSQSICPGYST